MTDYGNFRPRSGLINAIKHGVEVITPCLFPIDKPGLIDLKLIGDARIMGKPSRNQKFYP